MGDHWPSRSGERPGDTLQGEGMISGETIALTELRLSDSEALLRWINDPETVRFNAPFAPVHESRHAIWFDGILTDPTRIVFAVRVLDEPRIVGLLQLV